MDDNPHEPGRQSAPMKPSIFEDGPASSNGGELPPVFILKRFSGLAPDVSADDLSKVFPLLLGHGSSAGKRFPLAVGQSCLISRHKNLRVYFHTQIRQYHHPALWINIHINSSREPGSPDARCPYDGCGQ